MPIQSLDLVGILDFLWNRPLVTLATLLSACKVLHSGMQILENYACSKCCLLHDTNASCCKLLAIHPKSTFHETTKIASGILRLDSLWIKWQFSIYYEIDSCHSATLLSECLPFWRHARSCLVACKYLKICAWHQSVPLCTQSERHNF